MTEPRTLVGLFGTGGFAREAMPLLRGQVARDLGADIDRDDVVFVDRQAQADRINGHRVMSEAQFFACSHQTKLMNAAVGDGTLREQILAKAVANGARPLSIISPSAHFLDANQIGDGAIFCAYSMVTSNARIGRGFHCNIYAYVAHDCVIGDFVTFAPGVKCNGNVHVGSHAYLGTGAIIRQGRPDAPLRIGKGAVIGMGAVVTKDVPDGVTVVGNPARIVNKRKD